MRKKIVAIFAISVLLASCATRAGVSKKGNWSAEDKQKADEEIAKIDSDLDAFGDKKQEFIDCYLSKVEAKYPSFKAADSDLEGCTKIAEKCATEVMGK